MLFGALHGWLIWAGDRRRDDAARACDAQIQLHPGLFSPGIDIWALMLIGMALFILGVLQGERPRSFYLRLAVAGYAIGITVNASSTYGMITSNYDIIATTFWSSTTPAPMPRHRSRRRSPAC